ncbi:hypothetical protein [Caballeronia sp. Lep1P3]
MQCRFPLRYGPGARRIQCSATISSLAPRQPSQPFDAYGAVRFPSQ